MADTKQLSQATIINQDGEITTAHFAADIDNFIVYDKSTGSAYTMKDLLFGNDKNGQPVEPTDFAYESMWRQLEDKADRCIDILDQAKDFWNGLSEEEYKEPTENGESSAQYLATGDEVNKINFYGNDQFLDQNAKDKLISLGALEDLVKRIPTMGNPNNLAKENGVAFGDQAKAASNSFAFNGDAEGSNTISFHSQTNKANNVIAFNSQVDSNGAVALNGQVQGEDGIAIKGMVSAEDGIAIGSGTEASANNQTVIGHYNIPDPNASFILGTGTNTYNRKNAMKVIKNTLCLPAIRSNEEQTLQVGSYFLLRDENEFVFGGKIELRLTTASLTSHFYSIELPLINSFGEQSQMRQDKQSATIRIELDTRAYLYAKINYSQTDGVLVINTAELAFEDRNGSVWTDSLDSITIIVKEKMSIKFF